MKQYVPKGPEGWDEFWSDLSAKNKKAFDDLVTKLAGDIGSQYGPTLRAFQAAMDAHSSAIAVVRKVKKSDRAASVSALSKSVSEWLVVRDKRWKKLGKALGGAPPPRVTLDPVWYREDGAICAQLHSLGGTVSKFPLRAGAWLEVDVIAVGKQPPRDARSRRHTQDPGLPAVPVHFGVIFIHPGGVDHHPHKI